MKKIAIISELKMNNFNYGNRLQVYALNHYINNIDKKKIKCDTIVFSNSFKRKITCSPILFILKKVKLRLTRKKKSSSAKKENNYSFERRISKSNEFLSNNVKLSNEKYDYDRLKKSDYNYFIVGSDVVWAQEDGYVNRIKFLDFAEKGVKKCSYAASFGNNYIPDSNIKYMQKVLKEFKCISVREHSAKRLLDSIAIERAIHVCDPTMLISSAQWNKLEKPIDDVVGKEFVFVYLLGKDKKQREVITEIFHKQGKTIVTVPHADGIYSEIDDNFGDVRADECSPENWLWLIHNAELVVTDSFHGLAFSIIYNKKFFCIKRNSKKDLNVRVNDLLTTVKQNDKYIDITKLKSFNNYTWDYDSINNRIDKYREVSKKFISNYLEEG